MKLPRTDGRMVLAAALVLLGIGAVVLVLALLWQANDRMAQDYSALRSDYETLYSEALEAGAEPEAPAPSDLPSINPQEPLAPAATPEPGPTGPQGPGPTRAQVRLVVEEMFDTGEFDGEDGRPPTDAEIDAAVERYCAADTCDGEDGSDGANGLDGVDGTPGPPPTPEQIGIAIAAYCANQPGGSCEGATGKAGQDGTDGTDGVDGRDGTDGADLPVAIGDYNCPDDKPYMSGFSVAKDPDGPGGSLVYNWSVTCKALPPPITP